MNLLSIDHRCGILQQLVPSDNYLRYDHIRTYCSSASVTQAGRKDSELLCTGDLKVQTGKWLVTDEEKLQVYLELTVTTERCLEIVSHLRAGRKTTMVFSTC